MGKLRSMLNKLLGMNLAHILVLGLVVKSLISDISYPAFLLTIPVLAYESYKLHLKSKKPDPHIMDMHIRQELDNMKSKLNASTLDSGLKQNMPKRYF